jgi:hypothetical protein
MLGEEESDSEVGERRFGLRGGAVEVEVVDDCDVAWSEPTQHVARTAIRAGRAGDSGQTRVRAISGGELHGAAILPRDRNASGEANGRGASG